MNVKTVRQFKCSKCNYLHRTSEDARKCCPRKPLEIVRYFCGRCEWVFKNKQAAEECCREEEN